MRLAALAAAALIVAAWSCTKLPSDPGTPFSIAFRRAPSPSVVLGDVMRDSTGQPAKLQAFAFNLRGDTIRDFPVTYFLVAKDSQPGKLDDGLITAYTDTAPGRQVVERDCRQFVRDHRRRVAPFRANRHHRRERRCFAATASSAHEVSVSIRHHHAGHVRCRHCLRRRDGELHGHCGCRQPCTLQGSRHPRQAADLLTRALATCTSPTVYSQRTRTQHCVRPVLRRQR